jgi:hypothetical protein
VAGILTKDLQMLFATFSDSVQLAVHDPRTILDDEVRTERAKDLNLANQPIASSGYLGNAVLESLLD